MKVPGSSAASPTPYSQVWTALTDERQHRAIRLMAHLVVKRATALATPTDSEDCHDHHPDLH